MRNRLLLHIEHYKQCNSFKTRALTVKEELEKDVAGVNVVINPENRIPNFRVFFETTKQKNQAAAEQKMKHERSITKSLPNGIFRFRLDNEEVILGYISSKIRKNFIPLLPKD
nr:translation initiation factor IF-1, chloroplastic [Ipomoea batatas]